jgi:hypothetical protein
VLDTGTNLVIIIINNNGIAIVGWFFVVVDNLCLCLFENFQDQRTSGWGCGLKVFRIKECPFQGRWTISGNSWVSSKNRQRSDGLKDRFFGEFFGVFENHNYGLRLLL